MSQRLTFSFPYSPREHAQALSKTTGDRSLRRWFKPFGAMLGVIGLGAFTMGLAGGEPIPSLAYDLAGWIGLGSFWFFVAPWVLRRSELRQLQRDSESERRTVEVRGFDAEGFVPHSRWSRPIPWADVERVVETTDFFLIYASSDGPDYLPKHVVSGEELNHLRTLLEEVFVERRKQLKLLPRAT
jgi:hypothetical protein